jgi:hypothetical protein
MSVPTATAATRKPIALSFTEDLSLRSSCSFTDRCAHYQLIDRAASPLSGEMSQEIRAGNVDLYLRSVGKSFPTIFIRAFAQMTACVGRSRVVKMKNPSAGTERRG